jgi:hypothetical protein
MLVEDPNSGTNYYEYIKPYEFICKENFSFLMKLLRIVKMDEGLDFTMRNSGFTNNNEEGPSLFLHNSVYKALRVRAERNGGNYVYKVRVSNVIKSNNYALDFSHFIKASKRYNEAAIKKCNNCRSSKIFLGDKLVWSNVYSKLLDISMANKDDDNIQKLYVPSMISLESERYSSDIAYRKEGLFIHRLKNNDEKERDITEVLM